MQQYHPCNRCGAHNIIGAASCSHCGQQLFYNCPHCGTWVDNRYPHCPQCHRALNWPGSGEADYSYGQTWYVPQETKKRNSLPAILVSLIIIGAIVLAFVTQSNSSTANQDTIATLQTMSTGVSPSGNQGQITVSSAGPTTSSSQSTEADGSSYLPVGVTLTTTGGETIEIDMTPSVDTSGGTGAATTTTTIKRSAYLEQIYPNWGHCTKGSCQSYTQ